jgi:astacin
MKKIKTLLGFILLTIFSTAVFAQEAARRSRPSDSDTAQNSAAESSFDDSNSAEMYRPNDSNRQAGQIKFDLPFFNQSQLIDVEIVNGKIIFEGDIILGDEEMLDAPQIMLAGNFDRRWENGVIPFVLSSSHPEYWDITAAIDTINRKSNLSLIPQTNETDYIEFDKTDGCSSKVGRQGGKQIIQVEKCSVGSIMHEILHAAGFYHEQSREDRDEFVTINWDNIEEGKENNFKTYGERKLTGSDIGSYDYDSIMHYAKYAFSKNKKPTIEPKDSTVKIGNREYLSTGDLRGIRKMYPTKAKPYEPPFVQKKRDTDLMTKPPKEEPMMVVKPKKPSSIFKP